MAAKRTLLLLWAVVAFATAQAQYNFLAPELGIGINQGVNLYPRVSFAPSVNQAFDVRYHGGITLRYSIQKYFAIQTEVNYSQLGWKEADQISTYKRRLDYLEIPLLTQLQFGRKVRFLIHLGPELRVLLHEASQGDTDGGIQRTLPAENRVDFGITGGLGLEFRSDKAGFFVLGARYNFGMGNLFHNQPTDAFNQSSNQSILVSVTYLYDVLKHQKLK